MIQMFWNKKTGFEKTFWKTFFLFIFIISFCLTDFQKWQKYFIITYNTNMMIARKTANQKTLLSSSEVIEILKIHSKNLEKVKFDLNKDILIISGFGNFNNTMQFLYQIEKIAQNFIIDFYLHYKYFEKINFKIIINIKEDF